MTYDSGLGRHAITYVDIIQKRQMPSERYDRNNSDRW